MIQLKFTLTEKEFLDCNYYTGWGRPEKRISRLRYFAIISITYIILFGFISYDSSAKNFDQLTILIGLIVSVIFIFFLHFRMRERFDKQGLEMIRSSKPDSILSEMEMNISETGISGKTNVAEVKYTWDAFQKKVIANECFYLYLNSRQALIIPFRVFKTTAERESFEKMLAQYLPLQADLPVPGK